MRPDPLLQEYEEIRLLFEALCRLLAEKGYQRRGMCWYSYSNDLIRIVGFDPRLAWVRSRFTLGVALRALDGLDDPTVWDSIYPRRCRVTHPQIDECAVSISLVYLVDNRAQYEELADFTYRRRLPLSDIPGLIDFLVKFGLPFLESLHTLDGVRKLAHSNRATNLSIRETARRKLSGV